MSIDVVRISHRLLHRQFALVRKNKKKHKYEKNSKVAAAATASAAKRDFVVPGAKAVKFILIVAGTSVWPHSLAHSTQPSVCVFV